MAVSSSGATCPLISASAQQVAQGIIVYVYAVYGVGLAGAGNVKLRSGGAAGTVIAQFSGVTVVGEPFARAFPEALRFADGLYVELLATAMPVSVEYETGS